MATDHRRLDAQVAQETLVDDPGFLKEIVERVVQELLEAQMSEHVGAAPYERTDTRKGHRNGYKPRTLRTRVGTLNLLVPQDREGTFSTRLFSRYQRNEKALVLALMEMYVEGVSTRKVKDVTEELCGASCSRSTVSNIARFAPGDRVTANPLVSCGRCSYCKGGAAHLCAERKLIGAHRPGAYAEYVTVPEENVRRLPDSLSLDEGALAEPFACAVHVCRLVEASPADRMLVVGAGPIGLLVLRTARIFGLEGVVVTDLNEGRLEIARSLGGVTVGSGDDLRNFTPEGGFDVAVDAVGVDATRRRCVEAARPGGRVVFSGLHEAESPIPVNLAIRNELRLQGAFCYAPTDFELALRWLGEGKADLSPWMAHAPLGEGKECFEKLLSDPGKIAKMMLEVS